MPQTDLITETNFFPEQHLVADPEMMNPPNIKLNSFMFYIQIIILFISKFNYAYIMCF